MRMFPIFANIHEFPKGHSVMVGECPSRECLSAHVVVFDKNNVPICHFPCDQEVLDGLIVDVEECIASKRSQR